MSVVCLVVDVPDVDGRPRGFCGSLVVLGLLGFNVFFGVVLDCPADTARVRWLGVGALLPSSVWFCRDVALVYLVWFGRSPTPSLATGLFPGGILRAGFSAIRTLLRTDHPT